MLYRSINSRIVIVIGVQCNASRVLSETARNDNVQIVVICVLRLRSVRETDGNDKHVLVE